MEWAIEELSQNVSGKAPACRVGAPFWPIESTAGEMVLARFLSSYLSNALDSHGP